MKQKIKESLDALRLNNKLMQKVKGGNCRCGCHYADSGGSSTTDNYNANHDGSPDGLHSPGHDIPHD